MLSRLKFLMLTAATLMCAACPAAQSGPQTLAPGGTIIVVAKDAPAAEQDAAKLLQAWLRKTCEVTTGFEIQNWAQGTASRERGLTSPTGTALPKDKMVIALGSVLGPPDPRVAKLHDDGFLIHRAGSAITVAGRTATGTYFGAVAFLDRYAGVRFYMPGDLWTSRAPNHKVVYDGADFLSQPFVESGFITGIVTKSLGDADWLRKIGGSRRKGGTHQHDLYAIFPPEKFAATHPEIYPMYDGQRYIPKDPNDQSWQIDFAEPYTIEAAKETITEYFQKTPDAAYIAVSVNDTFRWSQSDANQKIIAAFHARDPKVDSTLAATSDIYWRFMNRLAAWLGEKFPGKMLIGLAYAPTAGVPTFKLAENIVVFTNFHVAEMPWYLNSMDGQPSFLAQWLAVAHHFGNHDWYEGDGYLFPRVYSGYWSQFLQGLAKHLPDAYMHAEAYPNWGFDGPKYYIMAKMWWEPMANPKTLTRQFCEDLFGQAASPMNNYFSKLESLWIQLDETDGPKRKLDVWSNQFTSTPASRAIITQCQDELKMAAAAAQTSEEKERVSLFARCFAFSVSLFDLAAKPTDALLHDRAVNLAQDLAKDPWTFYTPPAPKVALDRPLEAIAAIYKGPAKIPAAK